jgi:hypothetical protein
MALTAASRSSRLANPHAGAAHTATRRARRTVGVRVIVRMAGGTMRFASVASRGARRASVVFGVSDDRHMADVDAYAGPAKVVDLEAGRNRTALKLPRDPMDVGLAGRSAATADSPVAVAVRRAEPNPTVVRPAFLDPPPKPNSDVRPWRSQTPTLRSAFKAKTPPIRTTRRVGRVDVAVSASHNGVGPRLTLAIRAVPLGFSASVLPGLPAFKANSLTVLVKRRIGRVGMAVRARMRAVPPTPRRPRFFGRPLGSTASAERSLIFTPTRFALTPTGPRS